MKKPLVLDPRRGVAIKRSVHEITVDVAAEPLARALREVLVEPDADFGGLRLRRERRGDFVVGERFRGAVALPVPRWVEERFLSDHCEIVELSPRRARYRYLAGTPIAGESTIEIVADGSSRSRIVQTFEYQELNLIAVWILQRFGVALHDRAFVAQARRAAERAGGRIVASTIA